MLVFTREVTIINAKCKILLAIYYTALGNNTDFNPTMQTVTIVAGTNSTTVNIPVDEDDIQKGNEMFTIILSLLSSLNSAGVVLVNDNAVVGATGIIIDSTSESCCCTDVLIYCIIIEQESLAGGNFIFCL